MASIAAAADVPLVDFSKFLHGTPEEQREVASQVDSAFSKLGFVFLKNHGVPKDKVEECFQWSKRFFDLPADVKMLAPHPPGGSHHRGYSGLGVEKVSQNIFDKDEIAKLREELPDVKESYESGNVHDKNQPNIWLPEDKLPGFRAFMESFFLECSALVHKFLDVLSLSLSLDAAHSLSPTHAASLFQLRILHYPSLPLSHLLSHTRTRISAHSDFGTITLLFQDRVGGLEIEDPNSPGSFKVVEPVADAVLVNVGDLLMRWSNNRWRSAVHRVGAPLNLRKYETCHDGHDLKMVNGELKYHDIMVPPRYSVPFFATADDDAVIDALPGTYGEGNPKRYEPMTAREYVQMRMAALYNEAS